jgi:hypothetical protein
LIHNMVKKNTTILSRLETLLTDDSLNAHQIIDAYKRRWPKTTPSMRQLSNLLSRHKQFVSVGDEVIANDTHVWNSYSVKVWALQERMV